MPKAEDRLTPLPVADLTPTYVSRLQSYLLAAKPTGHGTVRFVFYEGGGYYFEIVLKDVSKAKLNKFSSLSFIAFNLIFWDSLRPV